MTWSFAHNKVVIPINPENRKKSFSITFAHNTTKTWCDGVMKMKSCHKHSLLCGRREEDNMWTLTSISRWKEYQGPKKRGSQKNYLY